jgi:phenylacetate-CoA ligase
MVVIRGVNVYPSAIEDVIRACGGVAEYRAEITTVRAMTEISLKIEPAPAAPEDLTHRLESGLRDALGLRIPTEIVEPGTLPRFEMKARRWVRS